MSDFECPVVRIKIIAHPNADSLEIAQFGDYQSIVKKGQFQDGDLAVYIPEQAVLPEYLLREMEMWDDFTGKGKLAGSAGTRLKPIKLRGVLSQGLIYPVSCDEFSKSFVTVDIGADEYYLDVIESDDVSEFLGITKYEPPLPSSMKGRVLGADFNATAKYDFENIKKQPSLFIDAEYVVITEKIHGTLLQIGVLPTSMANDKYYKGRVVISSKGQGAKGYILDHNDEGNLYAQVAKKHGLLDAMLNLNGEESDANNEPIFLFGEVYGVTQTQKGVQDLTYDRAELGFRAFDVCLGNRGKERFLAWDKFQRFCHALGVRTVPELYVGPYSKEKLLELTGGLTTLGGGHIREGVVVKAFNASNHESYGRKIAKSVSEAYLLRKGETTEFA